MFFRFDQVDKKKIGEMELDSAGLRQLVKVKSKELANVKKLAAVILQKRNEVRVAHRGTDLRGRESVRPCRAFLRPPSAASRAHVSRWRRSCSSRWRR